MVHRRSWIENLVRSLHFFPFSPANEFLHIFLAEPDATVAEFYVPYFSGNSPILERFFGHSENAAYFGLGQ